MTPVEKSLVASFEAGRREPAWLLDVRRSALARLTARGLPTPRDEDWRFTSLAALSPLSLARAPDADGALLLDGAPPGGGARLVFVNGRFRHDLSSAAPLPEGAILASLASALARSPEKVRPHLGRLARPDEHGFVAANTALFEDGGFLWLPPGAALATPVALVFIADASGGPQAAHPRTLLVAGEGARAAVEEVYLGREGTPYLTNAVTEIVLGPGAEMEHVRIQREAAEAFHVSVVQAEQGAGARLASHAFSLGAAVSRAEIRSRLAGEGAGIAANGLALARGRQIADSFSWVEHAVPRCTTTESYKGVLDDAARGVFSGRIRVLPGAQKTVARQMISGLLLSRETVVDAKPQLEILADDVKCGHGGTVGQLDEAALFYLRSRGVPEDEARSLLVWAFAGEMVGLVSSPALRARARHAVAARLPAGARLLEAA